MSKKHYPIKLSELLKFNPIKPEEEPYYAAVDSPEDRKKWVPFQPGEIVPFDPNEDHPDEPDKKRPIQPVV